MNNKFFAWAAAAALTLATWACSPEEVAPRNNDTFRDSQITLHADNSPHIALFPVCSGRDSLPLADATGGFLVNYNGGGTASPSNGQASWGSMEMYNGLDQAGQEILALEFTLASNWYIEEISTFLGDPAGLAIGPNGVPIINGNWNLEPVNPVINAYQSRLVLDGLPSQNTLLVKLKVGQLDWLAFDGTLEANSVTELWVWNNHFNDPASPLASNSPLQTTWNTVWCSPPTPQDIVLVGGDCSGCESENTVTFFGGCQKIEVVSCKDLSNVVLVYDDCSWEKFDGLTQKSGTFSGTGSNSDKLISHAYIKSGCHKSGEGPGFGRRFDGPCVNTVCQLVSGGGNDKGNRK